MDDSAIEKLSRALVERALKARRKQSFDAETVRTDLSMMRGKTKAADKRIHARFLAADKRNQKLAGKAEHMEFLANKLNYRTRSKFYEGMVQNNKHRVNSRKGPWKRKRKSR